MSLPDGGKNRLFGGVLNFYSHLIGVIVTNETRQFYTYLHCKPDGYPFYVGKGNGKRAYEFRRRNDRHAKTITKYGKSNIQVYIFHCDSESQAFMDEIQQIKQLRSEGFDLVNQTNGGDGIFGHKRTPEHTAKLLEARKGYKHTDETKKKMSIAAKGKQKTESAKKKMSEYAKNRSQEHIKKISASMSLREYNGYGFKKGHIVSEETRAKMSARMMGNTIKKDLHIKNFLQVFDKSHCEK